MDEIEHAEGGGLRQVMARRIEIQHSHGPVAAVLAYQPPDSWLIQVSSHISPEERALAAMALLSRIDELTSEHPDADPREIRAAVVDAVFATVP